MIIKENKIRSIIRKALLKEYQRASQQKRSDYNAYGLGRGLDLEKARKEKYSFNDLPVAYSQVSMAQAAAVAQELHDQIGGVTPKVKEGNIENHKKIVDLIHKPAYKMFRDRDMDEKTANSYISGLASKAWSSWFLNRCYEKDNPAFEQIKKSALGFTDSGCCYPYAYAAKNRYKLMNEPEKLIGQEILILVSKEEIDKIPEFSLEPGVASIVGQGGGNPDWENIRNSFELKGGEKHMNIYTGNSWIGGNLGDSTSDRPNDDNAGGFMILIQVGETVQDKEKRVDRESAVQDSSTKKAAGMDTSIEVNISDVPTTKKDNNGKEWLVYDSLDNENSYWVDFADDSMEILGIYLNQAGKYKELNQDEHADLFEFITSNAMEYYK